MSELSPVYSEYERISNLFRRLNEATLVARQAQLGIKEPSAEEEAGVRGELEAALEQLSEENSGGKANDSFSGMLAQLADDDLNISPSTLTTIRRRVKNGLRALTERDLEVIEKVSDVLDSKSELLFRRIQK